MREEFSLPAFVKLADGILLQVGLNRCGSFGAETAWRAHLEANKPANRAAMHALYDIQDSFGHGSAEDAVVDTIMNGGAVPLEDYPVPAPVWEALGFEIYRNGDGSHGAQVPRWLRDGDRSPAH